MSTAFISFLALVTLNQCMGRAWHDIAVQNDNQSIDTSALLHLQRERAWNSQVLQGDAGQDTDPLTSEIMSPSLDDSQTTTIAPSPQPSMTPSLEPTVHPTRAPTQDPTNAPTVAPTMSPTVDPFSDHVSPIIPDLSYFNYDSTSMYGPGQMAMIPVSKMDNTTGRTFSTSLQTDIMVNDNWGRVKTDHVQSSYWTEFTNAGFGPYQNVLQIHHPHRNVCETGLWQSPINVRQSSGGNENAVCHEEHEVRSLPGDFHVRDNNVEKRIEGNKLRLVYQRRPCADLANVECQEPDPPHADFPNGWGGFADVLHIDFKVQSEHTLEGERYDGEMQIFHIHSGRQRLAAQSVLIHAQADSYNYYFQQALDAFQLQYDKNSLLCQQRQTTPGHRFLRENVTRPYTDFVAWAKQSIGFRESGSENTDDTKLIGNDSWDPHHKMLIPTIHFYRYEGSLTEPPCGEFVSWWIADKPMTISLDQLKQLQTIIFTNVDAATCHKTSVHSSRSVARPLRPTNDRPVWKCTEKHFGPDP